MTEQMQRKGAEREIRSALLALLAHKDTPLEHIWQEILQSHLRENPPAVNNGESYVKNLPIDELITRFKMPVKCSDSRIKEIKPTPQEYSSQTQNLQGNQIQTTETRDVIDAESQKPHATQTCTTARKADTRKGRASRTLALNHSLQQPIASTVLKRLQKNIAKAQRESLPTPQIPPP